ncbi:MAG: M20/M25/M40 family metallo-hydrolase [Bacteroidales bacterium]|nr:M20/M25/M40 family metallo-hydrolase [Bacteroidales bacterium]
MYRIVLIVLLLPIGLFLSAQEFEMNEQARIQRLNEDVHLLASDSLLGREAGTKGEFMAMHYLAQKFREMNLKSVLPDNTYFQEFEFVPGATYKYGTKLKIGERFFKLKEEFYPLSWSASKQIEAKVIDMGFGLISNDTLTNDYGSKDNIEDKIFLMETSVPGGIANFEKYEGKAELKNKIKTAQEHGAAAVIFHNNDPDMKNPSDELSLRVIPADIPVVFVKQKASELLRSAENKTVELKVRIRKIRKEAYNVIGFIDNQAPYTLVFGAHYDHLGMGGPSSRYTGPPKIHNGADDNASGVAGILEIARKLVNDKNDKFNYLIIGFSAEEQGLVGSSYFTESNVYDMDKITAMINFDMIGRMKNNTMRIAGTGTSSHWDEMIAKSNKEDLTIKTSKSGSGGSDQMSFYLDSIPVLFYFTGSHKDYHTPADDAEKLDFASMLQIIETVERLSSYIPKNEKLEFIKTESKKSGRSPTKYTVTLGVMPDHSFNGEGMRIGSVIQGRVSDEVGMKDGDIVIQMGEYKVTDMMSYMKALSNFKKGNSTIVKIKRGNKILEKKVQFK